MLKTFFQWLDLHPGSYWLLAGSATLLLAVHVWFVTRQKGRGQASSKLNLACDALVLFLFIFAWRWPFLLVASAFNPDESQLIAGSIALTHDPVFWRSVDGTTSGPLNFYLLLPYSWFGIPLDYFTARFTGLLLIGGALFATHRALAGRFGRGVAWLAILPAAEFFATATSPDLIHYSSEHLTLFLVAVSIWLLAKSSPAVPYRMWLASFIAGASIWAKLQALPVSVALVGWALWLAAREHELNQKPWWRRLASIVMAALAPTLLVVALAAATGQMEDLVRRYLLQNLFYVGNARPLGEAIHEMSLMAAVDGRLHLLLVTTAVILLVSSFYFIVRRLQPPGLFIIGGVLTFAAFVAVLAPRREFLHYTLLLPAPLAFWVGAALGGCGIKLPSRSLNGTLFSLLIIAIGLVPVITRSVQPLPEIYGRFAYHWTHPRNGPAIIARELSNRNDSIAIWGWAPEIYVESGLTQATRDTHSTWSIVANEQRDYYRTSYLHDLRQHNPAVFIDAVGPGAFGFEDRPTQAHETFAALSNYIRENYSLVTDLQTARIYARNGLPTLPEMTPAHVASLETTARLNEEERLNVTPTPLTRLDHFGRKEIGGRDVLLIPPPTQIEWAIDENVREISLECGFDPAACEQGRSNGAGIFLELANDYGSQTLYHRFLDPVRQTGDRQLQTALVTLPAFVAGTRLILRTDAGPYDDATGDWIYLLKFQFRRGPPARR